MSAVLDELDTEGVGVDFTVGRGQRDLEGLGLGDRVERRRIFSDSERNEKMAPAGLGVDGEGCVALGVEDGTVSSMEGGAHQTQTHEFEFFQILSEISKSRVWRKTQKARTKLEFGRQFWASVNSLFVVIIEKITQTNSVSKRLH